MQLPRDRPQCPWTEIARQPRAIEAKPVEALNGASTGVNGLYCPKADQRKQTNRYKPQSKTAKVIRAVS